MKTSFLSPAAPRQTFCATRSVHSNVAMSALLLSLAASGAVRADGHYTVGMQGIQAATLPPPGLYGAIYAVSYNIDSFRAPGSENALPGRNKGTVSALAGRVRVVQRVAESVRWLG